MIKGLYEAHLPVSNLENAISFYQNLGLTLAYKQEKLAFLWIVKGESWLGLWESDKVELPYNPFIRHIAFRVEKEDMLLAKQWLNEKGIAIRTSFGFDEQRQPLVLPNNPHAHAAIYFDDPDGNSLELMTPIRLDVQEDFNMMTLEEWLERGK